MDAFPAFFSLTGRKVVVAGIGDPAEAKARLFAASPAELVRLNEDEALRPGAFAGALLAFIAGGEAFCRQAADAARAAGALVNVVDKPGMSDFNTPAVIDRGEVVVAIGTAGAAPMMAALLRSELESRIPQGAGRVAALFKKLQAEVRAAYPDLAARRAFLREAFASPAADAAAAGDMVMAERLLRESLSAPNHSRAGRVRFLRGDIPADQLSLKAARALAEADILIADDGVTPEIVTLARRDAERLAPGAVDIEALAELARTRQIVRVVAGPPERLALAMNRTEAVVEILPVAAP
jgi:precorrin-2 dehydrogenase / sirohydrochlorin ferrochelatase